MGWTTLYITGKSDFIEEVREELEGSKLKIMPGYTGMSSAGEDVHDLYWIDEKIPMRQVKEAIGSKLIWKYRLRFYASLEQFIESQKNKTVHTLTADEIEVMEGLKAAVR